MTSRRVFAQVRSGSAAVIEAPAEGLDTIVGRT